MGIAEDYELEMALSAAVRTKPIQKANSEQRLRICGGLSVKSVTGGLSELSKIAFGLDFVVVNSGFKFKRN
jgi:hypothetical protein